MDVQVLFEKLRQFCLWFFWQREWTREKILTLAILAVLVVILRAVIKRTKRDDSVVKPTAVEAYERRSWRAA
ncbi:MAG: hypothetical protein ACYTEQ_14140 [Planctomycetota bacterium]|jgi:hypothetical protein